MSVMRPREPASAWQSLRPGQQIRVTQTVRVGSRSWETAAGGIVREVWVQDTGIHTRRAPDDPVWVRAIQFQKSDGELVTVTLDENTRIEVLS